MWRCFFRSCPEVLSTMFTHSGERWDLPVGAARWKLHGILWQDHMAVFKSTSSLASTIFSIVTLSPPVINCTIGNIALLSWFSHAHGSNHFLAQVFKICWWMAHYGSTSPKRHKAFCNNKAAGRYNRGKLQLKKFREQQREESKPTARYVDSKGRNRYHGLGGKLKSTQTLCFQNKFGWAERGAATSHLQNWLENLSGTIWNVIVVIYFGIIQELSYQTDFAAINFKKTIHIFIAAVQQPYLNQSWLSSLGTLKGNLGICNRVYKLIFLRWAVDLYPDLYFILYPSVSSDAAKDLSSPLWIGHGPVASQTSNWGGRHSRTCLKPRWPSNFQFDELEHWYELGWSAIQAHVGVPTGQHITCTSRKMETRVPNEDLTIEPWITFGDHEYGIHFGTNNH